MNYDMISYSVGNRLENLQLLPTNTYVHKSFELLLFTLLISQVHSDSTMKLKCPGIICLEAKGKGQEAPTHFEQVNDV